MKATVEYVGRKFAEYNALCFGGELQPLPIVVRRASTYLGQVTSRRKRMADGSWHYYDFVFCISNLVDRDEQVVEDVILHEMIHYYILSHQLRDTSAHGRIFRHMMDDINRRYGRHITISHRPTSAEQDADTRRREHLVCDCRLRDGRRGLIVAAHTRLYPLWDAVAAWPEVTEWQWYSTLDPYFNRYRRMTTLKAYIVGDELTPHLADARPLVRDGAYIRVGRRE